MRTFRLLCFGFLASFVACGGTSEDSPASGGAAGNAGAATGGAAGSTGGAAGSSGGTAGTAGSSAGSAGSAGAAGSVTDAGIEAGTGGTGQCDAILAQHQATLQKAKECSLLGGGANTCSVQVYLPPCGHWDFVDSSNKTEIDELEALSKKFKSLNCPKGVCATGGYGPSMSTCKQPGGQGADAGRCQ